MSRAKRNAQSTCSNCDRPFYARALCKPCYMAQFKGKFGTVPPPQAVSYKPEDLEDFWSFVKAELKIG